MYHESWVFYLIFCDEARFGKLNNCHPGLDPGSRFDRAWIPAFAGMTEYNNVRK